MWEVTHSAHLDSESLTTTRFLEAGRLVKDHGKKAGKQQEHASNIFK